jgi:hypothetical protein
LSPPRSTDSHYHHAKHKDSPSVPD